MQSHEHPMSDSIKSHEDTLQLLFDATSGFEHADRDIKCRHCDQLVTADSYGTWQHVESCDESCTVRPWHVPAEFTVRPWIGPADRAPADVATCGTCGLSWDDSIGTEWTPAPSGRCPFESLHESATPSADDVAALESVGVDVDDVLESSQQAIWNYALEVSSRTVLDVLLTYGGPTVRLSAPIERDQYGTFERTGPVVFSDSWAVPSETTLHDDTYLVTLFDQYVETYQPADD